MKPERWKKIDELVQAALEQREAERTEFINEACAGDDVLRQEVESVLAYHEQASRFLESPAIEQAASLIAESQEKLQTGHLLGHYIIIEPLGRGGMGEVYLARDTKLDRKVALKLLPAQFTDDRERLRRFTLEARAASLLNHPNIIIIHEIGQSEGAHFIATEFIDGHTLRDRLARARMTVADALEVAIQAASALAAAHSAGIIHRDIKPENIMLRPDGYVKVLDFGLAKLTEARNEEGATIPQSALSTQHFLTEPGTLLGTVNYMSPEQARGLDVDARTDIFSLGAVMYEMAAGRMPFTGKTSVDVIVSILSYEPPPLSECAAEVPREFQRIVSRAISKNREERYHSIKDLLLDLRNLKEEIVFEEKLERSNPQKNRAHESKLETVSETQMAVVSPAQAQRVVRGGKRALALALIVIAIAAAAIGLAVLWPRTKPNPARVAPDPQRSVSYTILVQKYRDGKPYDKPFRLSDDINFEKDYQIRLNVLSSQSGYLYLLNEGPTETDQVPTFVVMFPSETANNGAALLTEGQQIQIPQKTWFQFDDQQGREKIWLVWAARAVDELEAVRRFANPEDKGSITDRGLRSTVYEFLKSRSSSRPSVQRDEDRKETIVSATGDILVHVIKLEHH